MLVKALNGELIEARAGMIVRFGRIREAVVVNARAWDITCRANGILNELTLCAEADAEVFCIGQIAEDFCIHNYEYCECCEGLCDEGNLTTINNAFYCEECRDDKFTLCEECCSWTELDGFYSYKGKAYCESCYDRNFASCVNCGEHALNEDLTVEEGNYYCESCWDDIFDRCENCNTTIRRDDAFYSENSGRYLCEGCCHEDTGEEESCNGIYNYSYKPDPIFHGGAAGYEMFCGMELEVVVKGRKSSVAESIKDQYEDNYYLKEDGSVSDGFEIVTHPRTFKSWEDYWDEFDANVLRKLREQKCSAHNSRCCGIHIHTSLDAWGGEQLFKLFSLFYNKDNYRHILTISQRVQARLNEWASLQMEDIGAYKERIIRKLCRFGHYAALSITSETLEIRIFNSNLRIERVKKNMEFVYALYMYTQKAKRVSWAGLVRWIMRHKKEVPNLFGFMKEKDMLVPVQERAASVITEEAYEDERESEAA